MSTDRPDLIKRCRRLLAEVSQGRAAMHVWSRDGQSFIHIFPLACRADDDSAFAIRADLESSAREYSALVETLGQRIEALVQSANGFACRGDDGSGGAGGLPDASTASFPVEDIYIARPTRWEITNSNLEHRGVISTWPSRKEFMATVEGRRLGIVASYDAALGLIKEYWSAE